MKVPRIELLLAAVATAGLGTPFLLIAVAQEAMSTQVMAATRLALAAAALALLVVMRNRLAELGRALRAHPAALLVVAATAAVLPNVLIGSAERHVPSGTAAVILATTPLWIALGAALIRSGDAISLRQWVALPAAVVGVALAAGAAVPSGAWGWSLLLVVASVSYAIANLTVRERLAHVHPMVLTTAEMLIGAAMLAPLALAHPGDARWHPAAWIALVAAGIGCTGLGWLANTALVQRVGATRASVVSYPAVAVSVLLGALVLDEPVDARVVAGTVILVGAVAVFVSRPSRRSRHMLELCILGFLAGAPMHAYELRRRISALTGHVRTVSDGSLNPALKRLENRGLVEKTSQPGVGGPPRLVYTLTDAGRDDLRRRLAEPADLEVTDRNSFFTILAFLHELPDPARQQAVLQRRLSFLEQPGRGFFVAEDRAGGTFRQGMTTMARATWTAERAWLRRTLTALGSAA